MQSILSDAQVYYLPSFLTKEESKALFQWCNTSLEFEQRQVKVFGKLHDQPRKVCMLGAGKYTYSGLTLEPAPIPWKLEELIDRVMKHMPADCPRFNGILVNYYRDGFHKIGMHSDDEADLDPRYVVGLSLGAQRHFDLHHKTNPEDKKRLELEDGSLVIMGPGCQDKYKHGIPEERKVNQPRISLTFRVMKTAAAAKIPERHKVKNALNYRIVH